MKCKKCKRSTPKSEWRWDSAEAIGSYILAAPRIYLVGLPALAWNSVSSGYRNLAGRKSRKAGICPLCNAIHVKCPECGERKYVRASEMGTLLRCRECAEQFYFVPTGS